MKGTVIRDISNFYIAGINYKKTDASVRSTYAVGNEQYAALLNDAKTFGIQELFILSTCNRTEIYGFAEDAAHLSHLLCHHTTGDLGTFTRLAYFKSGLQAVQHLFDVAAGLDSQILGDYEIVGQIKQAVKFARENNFIGAYTDRMVNAVLQSSKMIRSQTVLSGGTVSVSFAAIQYIRQHYTSLENKKILVLGVGKIGRNTCKNLVDYLGTKNITLINRTPLKAKALAEELQVQYAEQEAIPEEIRKADIIIVATNAAEPTILKADLLDSGDKLIIDMSVPFNVASDARELPGITLINVDELSRIKDATIKKRAAEVPKAKHIIKTHIDEFLEWNEMRKHVPVLTAVKIKLQEITASPLSFSFAPLSVNNTCNHNEKIQQVINIMALKMRRQNQRGCHYIEAINDFMAPASN